MLQPWGHRVRHHLATEQQQMINNVVIISSVRESDSDFPGSSVGKESTCNAREPGLIPESGRCPREGIDYPLQYSWPSLVTQIVKNLPAMWETWVGKIPWRRAWQLTPVLLPAESPWTEDPGRLQSMGSQRV